MPLNVRAAIAHAPNQPLSIATVQLDGPRENEVLVDPVGYIVMGPG